MSTALYQNFKMSSKLEWTIVKGSTIWGNKGSEWKLGKIYQENNMQQSKFQISSSHCINLCVGTLLFLMFNKYSWNVQNMINKQLQTKSHMKWISYSCYYHIWKEYDSIWLTIHMYFSNNTGLNIYFLPVYVLLYV